MSSWYWKIPLSLVFFIVFVYVALEVPMTVSFKSHYSLFTDPSFFIVFPVVFLLNSPVIYAKNPMFLLRLQKKSTVFTYEMKKMALYSLLYAIAVILFVVITSLIVGTEVSGLTIIESFIATLLCSLLLSGFIFVGSMYFPYRIALIFIYSVTLLMIVFRYAMFFDRLTPFSLVYVGMYFDAHHILFDAIVYAGYIAIIGLLYFTYDLFGKRDLL